MLAVHRSRVPPPAFVEGLSRHWSKVYGLRLVIFSSLRTCVALVPLRASIDVSAAHARAPGPGALKTQQITPSGGGEFKGKAIRARLLVLGYFPLFQETASPSPVMFWTVKAPFWYALVAPRPEETAHPLRSRQPPRGCAGQARRDAPTRNECRAHPKRPRPALRAGLAAPPTPLQTWVVVGCLLRYSN